ncbi:Meprin A subunit alpha [Varanus komodoensis]|nr:Meprin A subunit alpha [Varanus komodoensis]
MSATSFYRAFPLFSFIIIFACCTSFSVSLSANMSTLFCLSVIDKEKNNFPSFLDADAGELREDIPEINSDLNAKGVILKAFEGFHLKSCVNFKPRDRERSFIIFQKLDGCWSAIGDAKHGQNLSIGVGCDHKAIVMHEILHALGLFHEQTRTDRDDYVKIWWEHVLPDQIHNFKKYGDSYLTDLNTPYDYESIMHYGPFSFSKNSSLRTITARISEFNHIIGQRLDFSTTDLARLNRMYNCTSSLTLLDQCDFESADVCGLVQETRDDDDWTYKNSDSLGQDHTFAGPCKDAGHFMHFNTSSGMRGEAAVLESRILYPKRKQQCLQFFFKMTGSPWDRLTIWVKKDDGTGKIRRLVKIQTFQGNSDHNWKIAHVTLNVQRKFKYLFHGLKGNPGDSSGGISIDDLTLSETPCPSAVWLIRNFSHLLRTAPEDYLVQSPLFYSAEGYGYGLTVSPRGQSDSASANYTRISFHLISGENDGVLEWPVLGRQVTITVLDQDPDVRRRMSSERSFTTDATQVFPGLCLQLDSPLLTTVNHSSERADEQGRASAPGDLGLAVGPLLASTSLDAGVALCDSPSIHLSLPPSLPPFTEQSHGP